MPCSFAVVDRPDALAQMTDAELAALRGAATWYANYHAGEVADLASENAAYAVAERRRYLALVDALGKLGVRVRVPDTLLEERTRAA